MNRIEKLLEKVKNSPNNSRTDDVKTILLHYGFSSRKGKKNDVYWSSKYPDLRISIPRRNQAEFWTITDLEKLIKEINQRNQKEVQP